MNAEDVIIFQKEDKNLEFHILTIEEILEGFEVIRNYPYHDDDADLDVIFQ